MEHIQLSSFETKDEQKLRDLIKAAGWNNNQIEGQIVSLKSLASDTHGYIAVARQGNEILGYISAQFYDWNKLGQIQGLMVNPDNRRQNIATNLVEQVEKFIKDKGARGLYVDTPVDNQGGRRFYEAVGYQEAYIMPEYYDEGKDGVTYIKFFR